MDYKKEIEQAFYSIMKDVYTEQNLQTIPQKYHDLFNMFGRFYPLINYISQSGLKRGLDFGCGCAITVVLGKLMGLDITGIDTHDSGSKSRNSYRKICKGLSVPDCIYTGIQNDLRAKGYIIINRNTGDFPWSEFKDDAFEFMCSYWGLNTNHSDKECDFKLRYQELIRITKPKGIWYIWPGIDDLIINNVHNKLQEKEIIIKNWVKRDILYSK